MPEDFVQVAPDSSGAKVRTRSLTVGANTVEEQVVIALDNDRVATFEGMCGSPLIPGNAATPQNLFSIGNTTGSAVTVAVTRLSVATVMTAASTVRNPNYHVSRISTAPTGGLAMTKQGTRSADSSAANVEVRAAASADGTASTITATAGAIGTRMRGGYGGRLHTAVGTEVGQEFDLIRPDGKHVELVAGQFLLLQALVAAAADNVVTRFYAVNCTWEEFTRP